MNLTHYGHIKPYVTKDGSVIRELMHPQYDGSHNQSLAEATVAPGQCTQLHRHHATEELYFITSGEGRMTLGKEKFDVRVGDTICIPSGTPHCIQNTGVQSLVILCCCAPAYSHDDTELLPE
jgi:mannose-6-phosphate isomerase-like protein (cupin superfamily)